MLAVLGGAAILELPESLFLLSNDLCVCVCVGGGGGGECSSVDYISRSFVPPNSGVSAFSKGSPGEPASGPALHNEHRGIMS